MILNSRNDICVVGVDLGGTKILASKIQNLAVVKNYKSPVPKNASEQEILNELIRTIEQVFDDSIAGIGIGVPSVVDVEKGIVYDVINIPSWKEVHLKEVLEKHFNVPTFVNNDANCFALGEKYFGKGKNYKNVVGLIIGTGIAAGLIINDKLYSGKNCGAGEFGMISYKDKYLEYYACGQFFSNVYGTSGDQIFQKANEGDLTAQQMFSELGHHIGNAVNTLLYSIDPDIIVMGGSVSQAHQFFEKAMWEQINTLVFPSILENIKIEISTNPDVAVLGAAALYFDATAEQKSVSAIV